MFPLIPTVLSRDYASIRGEHPNSSLSLRVLLRGPLGSGHAVQVQSFPFSKHEAEPFEVQRKQRSAAWV